MPTVNLNKSDIDSKIGVLSEDEFNNICFQFGLELDEVTSEYDMVSKEQGHTKAALCSKEVIYKVDVPANRYDLLCVEGLTRALMIFQGKTKSPRLKCNPKHATVKMTMTSATQDVRPYAVAAILRGITFTKERYNSFINLQDKLHMNIGRKRSIVSIGTHDLDTLKGPFIYDARRPCDIRFTPLNETRDFTAEELMTHYSLESHLKPYLNIISDCEVYPVIYDSQGTVLSLPPIINGDHSKITLETKNVFIEITATNLHKASVTLDTIVAMFSEYCSSQFEIEPVEIIRPDGSSHQYPELTYRKENVSVEYINKLVGIDVSADEMADLLEKMGLKAEVIGLALSVEVPPTRHDVLHRVDIAEDVAIAFGYDNIPKPEPKACIYPNGGLQPLSKLADKLRLEMVKNQFTELLTFSLCSRDDISTRVGKELSQCNPVQIGNPKTAEFQVVRTSLLPGILSTLANNQHVPINRAIRVFEVQDVVLKDANSWVGAVNSRRLCAVQYGMEPGFEYVYDVLHSVMHALQCDYHCVDADGDTARPLRANEYSVTMVPTDAAGGDCAALMDNRAFAVSMLCAGADVASQVRVVGHIGVVRPSVMKNFGIKKGMASMFEIEIEHFL